MDLASANAFYRSAPAQVTPTPVFIHGVPTSSDIWEPILQVTGGIALDLPGFGRSDKGGHLDYSVAGLARATTELVDRLELDAISLVGHGWGALVAAQAAGTRTAAQAAGARRPAQAGAARTERLVLISPLALHRPWPRAARICRTRGLGELAMGSITRPALARLLRRGSPQAWTDAAVSDVWQQFDQGTQRAVLRLHRSAPPEPPSVEVPTFVLYGEHDPWLGRDHAEAIAAGIPAATLEAVGEAGHWPWLDRPEAAERIAAFLAAP